MSAPKPNPRAPLLKYVRVQQVSDRELLEILKQAAASARSRMLSTSRRQGVGAVVRTRQFQQSVSALQDEQSRMWLRLGDIIKGRRLEAAAAGIDASAEWNTWLLDAVGEKDLANVLRRSLVQQAKGQINKLVARVTRSKMPLSDRVYKNSALANGTIDKIINNAIGRGASARELASDVARFISPSVPGGASYSAMRLGRTELNNAFHASSIMAADEVPWVPSMQWHLSRSHGAPDRCDTLAGKQFPTNRVPGKPHPQCLCYVTPVTIDEDEFAANFHKGAYDSYLDNLTGGSAGRVA